jgi:hypothetical protein
MGNYWKQNFVDIEPAHARIKYQLLGPMSSYYFIVLCSGNSSEIITNKLYS